MEEAPHPIKTTSVEGTINKKSTTSVKQAMQSTPPVKHQSKLKPSFTNKMLHHHLPLYKESKEGIGSYERCYGMPCTS